MTLVLDTGVIVGAAIQSDPAHRECARLVTSTKERRVIPAPVLVEAEYLLRGTPAVPKLLGDILSGAVTVMDLDLPMYGRVDDLLRIYADLRVGFVDCAVLAAVERLGDETLATLDRRHFSVMRPAHIDALRLVPQL